MNNKQLVTEKTPYVAAILLAEAKDYPIPRVNHQKTITCFKERFPIHIDIPKFFSQFWLVVRPFYKVTNA